MDKTSIIKEMYWNIEEISESFIPASTEYQKAVEIKDKAEEQLIKLLPESGRAIFEKFMEAVGDVEILQDEEIYRQGFCLGLQLTSEAYIMNKNKIASYGDE